MSVEAVPQKGNPEAGTVDASPCKVGMEEHPGNISAVPPTAQAVPPCHRGTRKVKHVFESDLVPGKGSVEHKPHKRRSHGTRHFTAPVLLRIAAPGVIPTIRSAAAPTALAFHVPPKTGWATSRTAFRYPPGARRQEEWPGKPYATGRCAALPRMAVAPAAMLVPPALVTAMRTYRLKPR